MKKILSLILALTLLLSVALPAFAEKEFNNYLEGETSLARISSLKITTGGKAKQLELKWSALPRAMEYYIYRSTTGKSGSYKKIADTSATWYTDTGLKHATTYYYAVRAAAWNGERTIYSPYKKASLSTRITKSYALKRFQQAWKAMDKIWASIKHPEDAFEPPMGIGTYYPITFKGYTKIKQINAYLRKYFSKKAVKELDSYFMEQDGKLYVGMFMEMDLETKKELLLRDVTLGKLRYTDKTATFAATIPFRKANGSIAYNEKPDVLTLTFENGRWVFSQPNSDFWCYWRYIDRY